MAAVVMAAGCEDDDACDVGEAQCLGSSLVRSCVPGEDGNEWFVFECGAEERCSDSPSTGGVDGGATGATAAAGARCVGTCTEGAGECVSDTIGRYCVDGRTWELNPCGAGQRCLDGACQFADGGLQLCTPGARECGSAETEKVCDRDGSKWIEQACDDGEQCLVDRCAPDPDASCDVPSRCLDNKTALRCLGEDRGFEMVSCEGDTYCEDGRCRGNICALGSVCAGDNQIVECVDGETLRTSQCGVNEACKQDGDRAECVAKTCEPGDIVCGDPLDDSVDPLTTYSQCRGGALTESGLPEWVHGECTGLLECDPVSAALGNPCQQECTPGAQTCLQDPLSGIADGWAECQDDGTWGAVTSCNTGGLRQQCAIKRNLDASVLPEAICVAPVCAHVITNQDGEGGACVGPQIQRCNDEGQLEDAEDCEVGICRVTLLETQSDGRVPAACDEDIECEEGEQRCLLDGIIPSSLYQVCENGFWAAKLETCEDDATCRDYLNGEGLRRTICGSDCAPGEKRCNISDQVETCADDGTWGNAVTCSAGVCDVLSSEPPRDAACVLECVPGEVVCTGAVVAASDGLNTGYAQESVCDDDGVLGAPAACPADTACRVSSAGAHTGCVECVGPDVLGGNQWGYMDTRCDPAASTQHQECQADNTWADSRACSAGTSCYVATDATCGSCYINGALAPTCSETALQAQQVCGPCDHASLSQTLPTCTNSAISADTGGVESCETLFGDGPSAGTLAGTTTWGNVQGSFTPITDCCDGNAGGADGEFLLTGTTCMDWFGVGSVPAGGVSCCDNADVPGVGPGFAYCAPSP
ncbi:MAG: hypothetical protein PVI30_03915 [Myxococcales bacterium]|jgi:hypothetical protein